MHGIDVRCPDCGTINFCLDLVETDGCRWQLLRPLPGSRTLRTVRSNG